MADGYSHGSLRRVDPVAEAERLAAERGRHFHVETLIAGEETCVGAGAAGRIDLGGHAVACRVSSVEHTAGRLLIHLEPADA
jgi:hypothetical protein